MQGVRKKDTECPTGLFLLELYPTEKFHFLAFLSPGHVSHTLDHVLLERKVVKEVGDLLYSLPSFLFSNMCVLPPQM